MKKVFYYVAVFAVLCLLIDSTINYSLGQQIKNQSPYELAFASTGAILLESRLDCWAKIKTGSTDDELDHALNEILSCLELPSDQDRFLHQRKNNQASVSCEIIQGDEQYYLMIHHQLGDQNSDFMMTSISPADDKKQRGMEKKLRECMEIQAYYRYTGRIPERTSNQGRNKLLAVVWKSMNAEPIDDFRDLYFISGTAYSKKWEPMLGSIEIGGKKVNLQAAVKCSDKDSNTTLYLGVPLLLNDY